MMMNKKTAIGIVIGASVWMTGCTTVQPSIPKQVDQEPDLVGIPIAQRIKETDNEIINQVALLDKIKSGEKVGAYNVVTHNNNLDARLNSSETIPQSYAMWKKDGKNEANWTPDPIKNITQTIPSHAITHQKVKKIQWENNSLNKLGENLSSALGYELVIKTGRIKDKNINFNAENKTLPDVVRQLKSETSDFADIVVLSKNKTFNIIYK